MASFAPTMSLVLVILMGFLCSSDARTFIVGDEDGWILRPSENYTRWAEKHRFEIKDEVVFKYEKGHDSVLVVNRNDYAKCNKENPAKTLKNGRSRFEFRKSGPFFFISGHDQNCEKGQKLEIVVLSRHHRNRTYLPTPSPAAEPTAHSQPVEPPSHSPSRISPVEPPFGSRALPPLAENPTPSPPVKPPSRSSSPSPAAGIPIKPPSHSPSPHSSARGIQFFGGNFVSSASIV
ncbi:early nodulin-like protein 1 [Striga hermonthica]|uniref:Early nodulin-like protein 1 n=1 Tax=Striga hermonthica TaxID=68872 RepID=A0A9N7R2W7_STRHE|nr:early nodulin-like protein 1 [Striga hermonthica]